MSETAVITAGVRGIGGGQITSSDEYLDIDELADMLGVSASAVYHWVARGKIPCFRLGRLLRFRRSKIDDWVRRMEKSGREF